MRPFRAPNADDSWLASPAWSDYGSMLATNIDRLAASHIHLAGTPLNDLRAQAAQEVLTFAQQYHRHFGETVTVQGSRFLVGGHQPELFHVGVWAKNLALNQIARQHGLIPLNLIVDNDTIKHAELRLPYVATNAAEVALRSEQFDRVEAEIPYEEYGVQHHSLIAGFADRIAEQTRSWGFRPMLLDVWPTIVAMVERGCRVGNVFAAIRRQCEQAWGIHNLELPVSRLADTTAFRLFTHHLVQHLPAFTLAYNAAIHAYRERNHLRSRNHPAPELTARGDWQELPLWAWHREQPARAKLYARRVAGGTELRAHETTFMVWPDDPSTISIPEGWKIRPRALTLTLFVRLCLADAFVHGIGGGKYDEVTDDLMTRFFGIEPLGYGVVSATVRLPLPTFTTTIDEKHHLERQLRDVQWNPQYWPDTQTLEPTLVQQKQQLIQQKPTGRQERRQWFRQLQELTTRMRPAVASVVPSIEDRFHAIEVELAANEVLRRRDYAWPLFPEAKLRAFFTQSLNINESQRPPITGHEDHQTIGREGQRA